MILFLLVAVPLYTFGTDLIEAGNPDKGEPFLQSLLSTDISLEMRNRILYNLALSSLQKGDTNQALSDFQQIEKVSEELKPFVEKGVQETLKLKGNASFKTPPPLQASPTLQDAAKEVTDLLAGLTTLPYIEGENTPLYQSLNTRLQLLLERKAQWWGSVMKKQEQVDATSCPLGYWEEIVENLSEGTVNLEKAASAFSKKEKPYAAIYPLFLESLKYLTAAEKELKEDPKGASSPLQTERFELLSEMFRKDKLPPPPISKGALW